MNCCLIHQIWDHQTLIPSPSRKLSSVDGDFLQFEKLTAGVEGYFAGLEEFNFQDQGIGKSLDQMH